jgi:hypothetical protein
MDILAALLVGAALGFYVGGRFRDEAWSSNGDQSARIFYYGQGYKVSYADDDEARP